MSERRRQGGDIVADEAVACGVVAHAAEEVRLKRQGWRGDVKEATSSLTPPSLVLLPLMLLSLVLLSHMLLPLMQSLLMPLLLMPLSVKSRG
jgi:hypothetical protein